MCAWKASCLQVALHRAPGLSCHLHDAAAGAGIGRFAPVVLHQGHKVVSHQLPGLSRGGMHIW